MFTGQCPEEGHWQSRDQILTQTFNNVRSFSLTESYCGLLNKASRATCCQWELHASRCVGIQAVAVSVHIPLTLRCCNVELLQNLRCSWNILGNKPRTVRYGLSSDLMICFGGGVGNGEVK